ncbi:MAG: crossover junction endodeoxyribonuclease RuvC [Gemmataceae bacterium]
MDEVKRILGIDPGLRITGYGVVEDRLGRPALCEAGVIRIEDKKSLSLAERVHSLYSELVEVLAQFEPGAVAVEQLYAHYQHPRTAILMGHARGVILLAAAQRGLPVVSYGATRIKKTITGNGRASKEQVQRTIAGEFGLAKAPEPADVSDALAVALCHYHLQRRPGA